MESFIAKRKEALFVVYKNDLPRIMKTMKFYRADLWPASPNGPDTSVLVLSPAAPPALSLACPVSLVRQQVPVRTEACHHVQTFGLRGVIFAMKFTDLLRHKSFTKVALGPSNSPATPFSLDEEFTCPLCRKSGPLYVDRPLEEALATLPVSVNYVSFAEDGKVVKAEERTDDADVFTVTDSPYNLLNQGGFPVHNLLPTTKDASRPATPFSPFLPAHYLLPTKDAFTFQPLGEPVDRLAGAAAGATRLAIRRPSLERCLEAVGVRRYHRLPTVDLTVESPT